MPLHYHPVVRCLVPPRSTKYRPRLWTSRIRAFSQLEQRTMLPQPPHLANHRSTYPAGPSAARTGVPCRGHLEGEDLPEGAGRGVAVEPLFVHSPLTSRRSEEFELHPRGAAPQAYGRGPNRLPERCGAAHRGCQDTPAARSSAWDRSPRPILRFRGLLSPSALRVPRSTKRTAASRALQRFLIPFARDLSPTEEELAARYAR